MQYDILQQTKDGCTMPQVNTNLRIMPSWQENPFFGSYAIEESCLRSPELSASDKLGSEVSFPLQRQTCCPSLQVQCRDQCKFVGNACLAAETYLPVMQSKRHAREVQISLSQIGWVQRSRFHTHAAIRCVEIYRR